MHEVASRALFEQDVALLNDSLLQARGWQIFSRSYPLLDIGFSKSNIVRLRVRLRCDDWNDQPPSIEVCDADGKPVAGVPQNMSGIFNTSAHPITGKPFICMRGSREYHTHSSHTSDLWSSIKELDAYRLGGIVTQIWRAWTKVEAG
jgi:hypothetical protein